MTPIQSSHIDLTMIALQYIIHRKTCRTTMTRKARRSQYDMSKLSNWSIIKWWKLLKHLFKFQQKKKVSWDSRRSLCDKLLGLGPSKPQEPLLKWPQQWAQVGWKCWNYSLQNRFYSQIWSSCNIWLQIEREYLQNIENCIEVKYLKIKFSPKKQKNSKLIVLQI